MRSCSRPPTVTPCIALVALVLSGSFAHGQSEEIIFADGRRETVTELRGDSKGRWTALRDGRRSILHPGEVVAVVFANGEERVTIPPLLETSDAPETVAVLASLRDPKNVDWLQAVEHLAMQPTRSVHDALVKLAADRKKDLRSRAICALARLRTKESVLAATAAILSEKDKGLRREAASVLFSVQEIFRRSDVKNIVDSGLEDRDGRIRIIFALLSPRDVEAASKVLRNDGLKDGDHHIRESAAVELGRRGDATGEKLLAEMLARVSLPGFEGDPELMTRYLVREQVEICRLLGKLGTKPGRTALQGALASPHEAVRTAAAAALSGIKQK